MASLLVAVIVTAIIFDCINGFHDAPTYCGLPVSTTHGVNDCILGSGASRRLRAVRWGVAGNLVIAGILTLPLSGLVAYFASLICMRLFA